MDWFGHYALRAAKYNKGRFWNIDFHVKQWWLKKFWMDFPDKKKTVSFNLSCHLLLGVAGAWTLDSEIMRRPFFSIKLRCVHCDTADNRPNYYYSREQRPFVVRLENCLPTDISVWI